jgi:hypothetical protein
MTSNDHDHGDNYDDNDDSSFHLSLSPSLSFSLSLVTTAILCDFYDPPIRDAEYPAFHPIGIKSRVCMTSTRLALLRTTNNE